MTVTLYLQPGGRVRKAAEEAIPSDVFAQVKKTDVPNVKKVPTSGHLVLQVGSGSPAANLEWWTARKGAMLVCLPEAAPYLEQKVRNHLDSGEPLVLLDAGLMKASVI